MADPLLFQTEDDGEILIPTSPGAALDVTLTDGFETADYISLFGGNIDDNGTQATERQQWWGNVGEANATRRQRSSFQALIESSPLTSALLPRLERAAESDLAWKIAGGFAESIKVTVSVPARNRVLVVAEQAMNGKVIESRMIVPYGVTP